MRIPRTLFGGLGNTMFQMAYIYAQVKEGNLPDIYLQDYKYFDKYRDEIKSWYGTDLIKSDYVSLHIRRGDYVNNPFYVDLTTIDYYQKAIAEFPDDKFLIFCADRQNFATDGFDRIFCTRFLREIGLNEDRFKWYFAGISKDSEIDDFNKMAGCKAHIMANSSFSWWASYVGGGKTVSPLQWFSGGRTIPMPDEWIKL